MPLGNKRRETTSTTKSKTTAELYDELIKNKDVPEQNGSPLGGILGALVSNTVGLIPGIGPLAKAAVETDQGKKQISKIASAGENIPGSGPVGGTVARLFDVLSRGAYTTANMGDVAVKRQNIGDQVATNLFVPGGGGGLFPLLHQLGIGGKLVEDAGKYDAALKASMASPAAGAAGDIYEKVRPDTSETGYGGPGAIHMGLQGLQGKSKIDFTKVASDAGVNEDNIGTHFGIGPKDVAYGAGFGLNVAWDPLTYIGLKKVAGLTKAEKIKAAVDAEPRLLPVEAHAGMAVPDAADLPGNAKLFERPELLPNDKDLIQGTLLDQAAGQTLPPPPPIPGHIQGSLLDDPLYEAKLKTTHTEAALQGLAGNDEAIKAELQQPTAPPRLDDGLPGGISTGLDETLPGGPLNPDPPMVEWHDITFPDEVVQDPPKGRWRFGRNRNVPESIPPSDLIAEPDNVMKARIPTPEDPSAMTVSPVDHGPGNFDPGVPYDWERDFHPFDNVNNENRPNWYERPKDPGAKENRGYVAFRLGQNDSLLRSYKAYDLGKKIGSALFFKKGGGEARLLYKMFSMNAHLSDGMSSLLRERQLAHDNNFNMVMSNMDKKLNHLSDGEREILYRAIDENTNLSHIPVTGKAHVPGTFETLEEYRQMMKGVNRSSYAAERAAGLLSKDDVFVDGYLKRDLTGLDKTQAEQAKALQKTGRTITFQDGHTEPVYRYKYTIQQLNDKFGINLAKDAKMATLRRAQETARKLALHDFKEEAVLRFGVPKDHPALDQAIIKKHGLKDAAGLGNNLPEAYVPGHVHDQIKNISKYISNDTEAAKFAKAVDAGLSHWKFLATQANPGHHIRNLVGDLSMNAEAGMLDPARAAASYSKSANVLRKLGDIEEARFLGKDIDVGTTTLNGEKVPNQKLAGLFTDNGGRASFTPAEMAELEGRSKYLGGWGNPYKASRRLVNKGAEYRELFPRMGRFIHDTEKLAQERGVQLMKNGEWTQEAHDIAREVGGSLRKWNVDYGALTPFEKNVMRRSVPFYTFMRNNIPRQIEMLLTKPGFMALYPKAFNMFGGLIGSDSKDNMLPLWVRENGAIRLQGAGEDRKGAIGWALHHLVGAQPGQQVDWSFLGSGSPLPLQDLPATNALFAQNPVQASLQEAGSHLTPLAGIPIELAQGHKMDRNHGQTIKQDPQAYIDYALGQTGITRNLYHALGPGKANWTSELAGASITPISENMMKSELIRRQNVIGGNYKKWVSDVDPTSSSLTRYQKKDIRSRSKAIQTSFKEATGQTMPGQLRRLSLAQQQKYMDDLVKRMNANRNPYE